MKQIAVIVTGRVQGVAFRAWTRDQAQGLGLRGWVRNRPDGSVEALLGGDADRVDAMLGRMQEGPGMARVDALDHGPAEEAELPRGFEIRR